MHKENKFFPYSRQEIDEKDIANVVSALKNDFITQGPLIDEFEKQISHEVKSQYSLVVNSATSALHLACLSLNLQRGDYLWTSPISFVASANCARFLSITPPTAKPAPAANPILNGKGTFLKIDDI